MGWLYPLKTKSVAARSALLIGGRGGSAVDIALVAPDTSSSVGRVLGNRHVEGRKCSFFVFEI